MGATTQQQNAELVDLMRPYFAPNSDLELHERLAVYPYRDSLAITDHFRGTALLAGWAWAGAPFAVPGAVTVADSTLTAANMGAGTRSFLQQALTPTEDPLISCALSALTVDFYCGVRLDDGTDNNYVEVVLRVSQASPTLWAVQARQRAGGGAVTTANGDDMHTPPGFVLKMEIQGTQWTAWGFKPLLLTNWGFGGTMWKPNTDLGAGALNWTPSRAGVILNAPAGVAATDTGLVDWIDLT